MELIDTHSHLFLEEFNADRHEVINRAKKNGVKHIVLPNVDLTTIAGLNLLSSSYPEIFLPAIGIHPSSIKKKYREELEEIKKILKTKKYAAVGETGIDLYWDKTFKTEQINAFEEQINLALENNLPIIIHNREAFNEIMEVLNNFSNTKLTGIFHCFTGNINEAEKIIDKGFYLGIGGVITFKNAKLAETIKPISIEKIVLETDSPYLAPVPKRGKRNESSYIKYIAEKIAEIKQENLKTIAEKTTKNAMQLFHI